MVSSRGARSLERPLMTFKNQSLINRNLTQKVKPYCLGFHKDNLKYPDHHIMHWQASPQIPYRPQGLLVWGANADTRITQCHIGNVECLKAGDDPIPALLFAAGYSFADFIKLKESPTDPENENIICNILREIPPHFPFQECIDTTLSPGMQITIGLTGPLLTLVTWGTALID